MTQQMILISPEIEKFPSIHNAFLANNDAIQMLQKEDELIDAKIAEMEKKFALSKELKLPVQGLKNVLTRLKSRRGSIQKQAKAYASGYLEIPRLQRNPDTIQFADSKYWGYKFNKNTPIRVLEAVKKAKEAGVFGRLVIFHERRAPDPILAGEIGDRYFYLASWR